VSGCNGFTLPDGPPPERMHGEEHAFQHLLIVADGFEAASMEKFDEAVGEVWDQLNAQDFDLGGANLEKQLAIWAYRLDSGRSSVNLHVPDRLELGLPEVPKTILDSHYGAQGRKNGLSGSGDAICALEERVEELEEEVLPSFCNFSFLAVLVNYPYPGGMAENNGVVWSFVGDGFTGLLLHEFGHVLGVADEYEAPSYQEATYTAGGGAPLYNNNISESATAPPWAKFLTESPTNLPTSAAGGKPDCRFIGKQPGKSPDYVGTFEGADHHHCGLYRPSVTCRMRRVDKKFCKVCHALISWRLNPAGRPPPI
jgi:hypothetical protein